MLLSHNWHLREDLEGCSPVKSLLQTRSNYSLLSLGQDLDHMIFIKLLIPGSNFGSIEWWFELCFVSDSLIEVFFNALSEYRRRDLWISVNQELNTVPLFEQKPLLQELQDTRFPSERRVLFGRVHVKREENCSSGAFDFQMITYLWRNDAYVATHYCGESLNVDITDSFSNAQYLHIVLSIVLRRIFNMCNASCKRHHEIVLKELL